MLPNFYLFIIFVVLQISYTVYNLHSTRAITVTQKTIPEVSQVIKNNIVLHLPRLAVIKSKFLLARVVPFIEKKKDIPIVMTHHNIKHVSMVNKTLKLRSHSNVKTALVDEVNPIISLNYDGGALNASVENEAQSHG